MKSSKVSLIKTGIAFSGCFLGAGFVSGQELYQFFSSFGKLGILGLFCAVLLLIVFGIITFKIVNVTGEAKVDSVICPPKFKIFKKIIAVSEMFFLFGIYVIMTSGAGALMRDLFGANYYLATFLFCVAGMVVILKGIDGMLATFSAVVPLLCAFSVIIALLVTKDAPTFNFDTLKTENTNVFLNNWAFSFITYVSYNMFAAIPIIIPIASVSQKGIKNNIACALGGFILLVIALSVTISMSVYPLCAQSDIPMLTVLEEHNGLLSLIYGILLMLAMFSGGVSSAVSVNVYFKNKFLKSGKTYNITVFTAVFSLLAWVLSMAGFSNLVGVLYPLCGYFGFIILILLCVQAINIKKQKKGD